MYTIPAIQLKYSPASVAKQLHNGKTVLPLAEYSYPFNEIAGKHRVVEESAYQYGYTFSKSIGVQRRTIVQRQSCRTDASNLVMSLVTTRMAPAIAVAADGERHCWVQQEPKRKVYALWKWMQKQKRGRIQLKWRQC